MSKPVVYGHRQLNFFFVPLISVTNGGFIHKKELYTWGDIREFDHWCPRSGMAKVIAQHSGISPAATLILKSGLKIKLNARVLGRKDKKTHANFFNGKTPAFDELVKFIVKHVPTEALTPACRAFYNKTGLQKQKRNLTATLTGEKFDAT